jgi:hypothetical protein
MIATGVANPNAQGHEIISTEMPMDNANSNDCPSNNQAMVDIRAIRITVGTKTRLTLSAKRAIGALDADASSSSFTICEKVVSSPTLVALKSR